MSSAVNVFVHAISKCSKKCLEQKWHILVPLDGFPCLNHYWVALELLYNMRLEPSFLVSPAQSAKPEAIYWLKMSKNILFRQFCHNYS